MDNLRRLWVPLAIFPVVVHLLLSLGRLMASWDDAAITAAFSRTWAETGRIALTPTSLLVEGYSSLSWFLLLAIPSAFTRNPSAVLVWMKVLSACAALVSLRLMYLIALREFRSWMSAAVSVLLLAFCMTTLQEINTGMEMNLAAMLLLLLFYILTRDAMKGRWVLASVTGFALLLTRFEMPFMLVFLLGGLMVAAYQKTPGALSLRSLLLFGLGLVGFFLAIEVWRHSKFQVWMPNTVYAKRFYPYRNWSSPIRALQSRFDASVEILYILALPLLVTGLMVFCSFLRRDLSLEALRRLNWGIRSLAVGCVLFGLLFGKNWGYPGRMVAAMIPFLILTLVTMCRMSLRDERVLKGVLGLMVVGQVIFAVYFTVRPPLLPSIATVRTIGEGADAIRIALHQERLTVMLPDVGGSTLCCEKLTILDEALLTDPTLAHTGWAGFDDYFRKTTPELFETHGIWAEQTQVYEHHLLDGYGIVASNGIRYFLRKDLYERLQAEHPEMEAAVVDSPGCLHQAYDLGFSLKHTNCLVLNTPGVSHNSQ